MKIALVAPCSVKGDVGGAERFFDGLLAALVERGHHVDLIRVPTDESNFEGILKAYEYCRQLDLSEFDMVISTKAPTFVVSHPNHVVYLVHTIRVFYDMFDQAFPAADETLLQQRAVIQAMDNEALARTRRRFSIGNEVSQRLRTWNGLDAEVLHPPLATRGFRRGATGDYFFLPGRLHAWKRVDLVIRAVQLSKLPLRLMIAGSGEASAELFQLANGDSRISFLGRIDDQELITLYADALAIPFVPMREDYGYITLEAFASAKAVITCIDSGEPTEFVRDGETGLVCDSTPESLCAAMERLFLNRDEARDMGLRGASRIESISWDRTVDRLLDTTGHDAETPLPAARLKVAVIDMQPIVPAVGGGRLRLLGLYHALDPDIDARYVGTYDWPGEKYRRHRITAGLEEINVPLSDEHHREASALALQAGGKTVIDLAFPFQCHHSPAYLAEVREAIGWADAVVFSHPWVFPLVRDSLRPDQVVIYDAHNVEGLLRAQILDAASAIEQKLLRCVVETEYAAGRAADLILACSQQEIELFHSTYGWSRERMAVIPNGVMAEAITPATPPEKVAIRTSLGLPPDQKIAFFIGSLYQPNTEAASFIVESLAVELPAVLFVIAGGVGAGVLHRPDNVIVTGLLDDAERNAWLRASDVAINPMFAGAGTNIKMFDFMAAGLPIVSTAIGARGIASVSGGGLRLATRSRFGKVLSSLLAQPAQLLELGGQNRVWVESEFAWERISRRVGDLLRRLVDCKRHRQGRPVMKRLAHLSTVGQACGVGEYTARLIEALKATGLENYLVTCATPRRRPLLETLPIAAEVGWHYDDEAWAESRIDPGVVDRLVARNVQCVVIQYHVAFFSGAALHEFAQLCLSRGLHVVVVVHNFMLVDLPSFRRMSVAGCTLLAHSQREVSFAAARGIRVRHLPLMVPAREGRSRPPLGHRDLRRDPPLIASTGFIRPHKGLLALIEALALIRESLPGARLLLQCSIYPSEDSREEYEACLRRVQELGLGEAIEFDTAFRPIDEVHRRLNAADLVVLPYGPSNEGGSAAAATVLASGVPLIVSDSAVFSELAAGGQVLADTEPGTIAQAVCDLFSSPGTYEMLARRAIDYADQYTASRVARHLLQLVESDMQDSSSLNHPQAIQ